MRIPSEKTYPYTVEYEQCREAGNDVFDMSDLEGYETLRGDENLLRTVATQGPIPYVLTKGTHLGAFKTTNDDDIFFDAFRESAAPLKINHAVLVVGYGSNKNGKYWLVKNSREMNWNQDGNHYFKLSRDWVNHCHIPDHIFVLKFQ